MLPHHIINDQTLMLNNFECIFFLSPSEIKQEVCKLLILISQRILWYKVLVVGKNGKLNETIEASALWSIYTHSDYLLGGSGPIRMWLDQALIRDC